MRTTILTALALVPLATGCAVAAAAVGGVLISQTVIDGTAYLGQIDVDAAQTWAQAKLTLSQMSTKPIETDDALRKAVANVDGATVTVLVETYDLQKSQLKVSAKEYGFSATETARIVFERIVEDLNRSTGR